MRTRIDETGLIELIRRRAAGQRRDVLLGIGDDAALLECPPDRQLVLATDTLVAGVHFPLETIPFDIGWKSLSVNLSDLAAMGAEPAWALLSLALPDPDPDWVAEFAQGFAALAGEHDVALVGGDTTRADQLVVTVQAAGFVRAGGATTRCGAAPGDGIWVTGTLGDAAAGLAVVHHDLDAGDAAGYLRSRLDRPVPRVRAGRALVGLASSAIDVSDGLGTDLGRVAAASEVGAQVELSALPASDGLRAVAAGRSLEAFQLAGDDYELCFTVPGEREAGLEALRELRDCGFTRIGDIVVGEGVAFRRRGRPAQPPAPGWRHWNDAGAPDA